MGKTFRNVNNFVQIARRRQALKQKEINAQTKISIELNRLAATNDAVDSVIDRYSTTLDMLGK